MREQFFEVAGARVSRLEDHRLLTGGGKGRSVSRIATYATGLYPSNYRNALRKIDGFGHVIITMRGRPIAGEALSVLSPAERRRGIYPRRSAPQGVASLHGVHE